MHSHRPPACSIVAWAFVAALAAPLAPARAATGLVEFTLAGAGSSDPDLDAAQLSGDAGLGFVLGPVVVGGRQSITYAGSLSDETDADLWGGSTRGFVDLQFKLGPVAPFVGATGGYAYGDLVEDQFVAGPEGGLKFYLGGSFIFVRAEYQFFFEDNSGAIDAFDDGQWVFALGVGMRL
jgi:hypothetical protein